jgi:predicted secreted protein
MPFHATAPGGPTRLRADHGGARRLRRLAGAAAVALAAGCAATAPDGKPAPPPEPRVVVADLRGYRIDLRPGERAEIRLPGNRADGYRWVLVDPVPAAIRPIEAPRFDPDRADLAGVPGTETWLFEAGERGTGPLFFEYRRPAEPASRPPAQRATFRVEVR